MLTRAFPIQKKSGRYEYIAHEFFSCILHITVFQTDAWHIVTTTNITWINEEYLNIS